jgi:hypothetical protein
MTAAAGRARPACCRCRRFEQRNNYGPAEVFKERSVNPVKEVVDAQYA